MSFRRLSLLFVAVCVLTPASAVAQEEPPGAHSPNMTYVKNIPYEARNGDVPNFGTDQEFTKIGGKRYGLFGSYRNGIYIVDVTKPAAAKVVGIYDCGITQGDVQIFRQADERGTRVRHLHVRHLWRRHLGVLPRRRAARLRRHRRGGREGRNGTFIVDVSNP